MGKRHGAGQGRGGIAKEPAASEMLQKAIFTAEGGGEKAGIKTTCGKVMWHGDRIKPQAAEKLMVSK